MRRETGSHETGAGIGSLIVIAIQSLKLSLQCLTRALSPTLSIRDKIRKELNRQTIRLGHEDSIKRVNMITRGWENYYLYRSYIPKFMDQNRFLTQRVRHWLRRKHKTRNGMKALYKHYPDARLKEDLGLYTLPTEPLWKLATASW